MALKAGISRDFLPDFFGDIHTPHYHFNRPNYILVSRRVIDDNILSRRT